MIQFLRTAGCALAFLAATLPASVHAQSPAHANAVLEPAMVEQLRALAQSQGNRYRLGTVSLPPRPQSATVATLELPARFCSAMERNAFHDSRFKPIIEHASQNNATAIAHMNLLLRLQAEASNRGDGNTAMALAQEAKAYEKVARSIYLERTALDSVFPRLMAVPVVSCNGVASR